ncbi:alpha/beta hydrolase [Actinomadura scrupuli]|uniref:alpha/beta hydrolase n=1 Tax=Actinomadura scrupuli TaxID=559629 RepID=UPI003D9A0AC9
MRLACGAITAAMFLTGAVAGGNTTVSGPAGRPLPALTEGALADRYAADRRAIMRAAREAGREGDRDGAARLAALAAPGRHFLAFDARGRGRAIEVVGDLAAARRVAILVPGADTTLGTFESRGPASPGGGARALFARAQAVRPGGLAVIAWLGYDTPATSSLGVARAGHGRDGARALRPLVERIAARGAGVALLCHSYGSVVCGAAAPGLPVTDLAVFGSPGMTVSSARSLRTGARVWAGLGDGDWMRYVPKGRFLGLGLGTDPTRPGFGARRFAAGRGGHGDYLKPGGIALRNLTLIALGRPGEVTDDR